MQHCQLLGGTLPITQQELINQTNQDPTGQDSSYLQDLLEEGYHSDEDVADEVGEEDAVANMAMEIEYESSKNKASSALPFHDNTKKFADPLIWWRQKKSHFPILSCLARRYLCIPATEAPSDRIFSTSSILLSKFRNRMDPVLKDEIAVSGSPRSLTVLPALGIKTRQSVWTGTGSKKSIASKKTLSWAEIVKK
jgi:hypothetical protein